MHNDVFGNDNNMVMMAMVPYDMMEAMMEPMMEMVMIMVIPGWAKNT